MPITLCFTYSLKKKGRTPPITPSLSHLPGPSETKNGLPMNTLVTLVCRVVFQCSQRSSHVHLGPTSSTSRGRKKARLASSTPKRSVHLQALALVDRQNTMGVLDVPSEASRQARSETSIARKRPEMTWSRCHFGTFTPRTPLVFCSF